MNPSEPDGKPLVPNTETALRESEAKYRTLFESIDDGFAIIELLKDGDGKVVDFIYREINPAFVTQVGVDLRGRRRSELNLDQQDFVLAQYERLSQTGEPIHFEYLVCKLGDQWFQVTASRVGEEKNNLVGVIFQNITERKRKEAARELLISIVQDLGQLTNEAEIIHTVGRKLAAHLGVTCYHYVDIDEDRDEVTVRHFWHALDVPPILGTYPLRAFVSPRALADWHAGKPTIVRDVADDVPDGTPEAVVLKSGAAAQKIRAFIAVGMSQEGKWKAYFAVADSHPREWTDAEVELIEEIAGQLLPRIERVRVEEALRVTEERYRVALQSAHMAAWDWNIVKDEVRWNDQHFLILGLQPEDRTVTAEFFLQFVHPDDLSAVSKALQKAVEDKSIYHMDAFRIIRANDQEVRWMTGYGRVVGEKNSKATRMVGVMHEVTAQVRTTQALHEKQLKLEIAQRAARIGIWGYDLVKQQGIATPEWNDLTGYPEPKETFEMETFLSLVHPDDRPQLIAAHNKAIEEQDGVTVEFRLHHPEKGWLWVLKRGHYIPPYDDVNASMMGSLIDITERKLFEQQKDDFISVASHELRTPVTSIKAYAEILAEKFAKSGDRQSSALMEKLDTQIDRLTALIYSLLDSTRIAEGTLRLEKTVFPIDDLLLEAAEMMRPIAGHQPINLSLKAAAWVEADRERIHQVLVNLLNNAIKYSSGVEAIELSSSVEKDGLRVCVQDAGIGISAQGQQRVFERFFRETEAAKFPGLGLGLFISANIIREHGGEIWVQSSPGKGALFCFTLPLVDRP